MKNKNLIIGINQCDNGSTGSIMINSLYYASKNGNYDVLACVPYKITNKLIKTILFTKKISNFKLHYYSLLKKLNFPLSVDGNYCKENTINLIKIIKRESLGYSNVIIHMHNLHMCELDVQLFYRWLAKQKNTKTLYTLHDCWAFTGGCYYYDFVGCEKWKDKCESCPQNFKYTKKVLKKRTKLINKIPNLTLIPCSKWLENEIKKSKLKKIKTVVNYGETSLEPFTGKTNLKEQLGLINKKILITVSAYWNEWKGEKYLLQLADILPEDYVLIVVGNYSKTHRQIINAGPIKDQKLLSQYYSISDVFVSVTQSDNLPLVLMEAQICGLPIVGFGHGGTPEEITDKSGIMVGTDNNVFNLLNGIKYVVEKKPFDKNDIIDSGKRFKKNECSKRQFEIYNNQL